jgi:hypothetical protein
MLACTSPPGSEVGTFRVTMALTENTCGDSAVNLQDGRTYRVQVRADGSRGYWRIAGQMPIEGDYDDGSFDFQYESIVASSAPDAGSLCQLLQTEELKGQVHAVAGLDAGADDAGANVDAVDAGSTTPSLTATHVFTIDAKPGTDCSEALSPRGAFSALPCTVSYDLTGTPTKSF